MDSSDDEEEGGGVNLAAALEAARGLASHVVKQPEQNEDASDAQDTDD